jgi:hypothetical protein
MLAAVAYRDEEDAQRARIEELERELDAASAQIAVLKGETSAASPGTTLEHSRISNGPVFFEREIALPYAISEVGYEAIATVLRTRLKLNATQVGRTLTVPTVFTLERDGTGTRIRLTGNWRGMPGSVIATTAMTAGFGGLMTAGALADVVTHGLGALHSFPVDVAFVALGIGIVGSLTAAAGWGTRRTTAKSSKKLLASYEGTLAAILAIAEEHAVRAVAPTRVAEDVADEAEADEVSSARATRRS